MAKSTFSFVTQCMVTMLFPILPVRADTDAVVKEIKLLRHGKDVSIVTFSPDGSTLATATRDYNYNLAHVYLWDVATGKRLRQLPQAEKGGYTDLRFSPDGRFLVGAGADWNLRTWKTANYRLLHERTAVSSRLHCFAISPDSKMVVSSGRRLSPSSVNTKVIVLRDLETGNEIRQFVGHVSEISSIIFSLDGRTFLSGSEDTTYRAWSIAGGKELYCCGEPWKPKGPFPTLISPTYLTLSPSGRDLVLWPGMEVGLIFDASRRLSYEQLVRLDYVRKPKHDVGFFLSAFFSPDGRFLASSGTDKTVRLWEVATGGELLCLRQHQAMANSIAFSPDGRMLAVGSDDGTVRLWRLNWKQLGDDRKWTKLSTEKLKQLWNDLGSPSPKKGYHAVATLATFPQDSVPFLNKQLLGSIQEETKQLGKLLDDLDSLDFRAREKASRRLNALGKEAVVVLREALSRNTSVEVRQRVRNAVRSLSRKPFGSRYLRHLRGLTALELTGTEDARQTFQELTKLSPESRYSFEIKVALQRWNK